METSPLVFVLNMAGAAALLIWAVRLVRTGFDRAFGGSLRLWLRRSTSNRLAAATSGLGVAVLLQSSTAVAMLMAGFVSAGAIGSAAGLAIVLGADLGSALVALLLTTRLAVVTPVLLLLGVLIFLRGRQRRLRQIGRILIGMALIFLSLDLIRAASVPLVGAEGARTALLYLASDPLTAFVLAALFAWLVHSSVAAVLLFATLATQGALPPMAAFAMVLGANLGGAAIAVVLTLRSDGTVRRVTWANLVLRGGSALVVLWLVAAGRLPLHLLPADPGVQALTLHLAFNAALVAICLPLVGPICRLAAVLVPDPPASGDADASRTALDPAAQMHPKRAFACAVRELVDMGSRIEGIVRQVPRLFTSFDETSAAALRDALEQVQRRSLAVRIYLARVPGQDGDEEIEARAFDLSAIAMNLEAGAEAIGGRAVHLARRKSLENLSFSEQGWRELTDFHDMVLRNVQQGISVLMTEDVGLARELVEQKEQIRTVARDLQSRHLDRLRKGLVESIETSAIHLELLRAFKSLNTSFAMIGYPLLSKRGELLESRLAVG